MKAASSSITATPRRRGRPAPRIFSPAEVAPLLAVTPEKVVKALELAPRSFFPSAWQEQGEWLIPERDVRALLGPGLPRLFPVKEFAELIGTKAKRLYELIARGVVPSRKVLGQITIPATAYWELPEELPADPNETPERAAARRSFFATSGRNKEVEP